ncbi:MAG: hypothetical protein Q4P36_02660 [Bowdeniella nasicola]|nr:hypothetical protein [Bowdeniella nasicola]
MSGRIRRARAAAALLALAAGCSSAVPDDTSPSLQTVIVEGSLGSVPTVSVPDHLVPNGRTVTTAIHGFGRELHEGDEALLVVTTFDGVSGEYIEHEAMGEPTLVTVDEEGVGSALAQTLVGEHEGSRLVLVERLDVAGRPQPMVTVVDILSTVADGTVVAEPALPVDLTTVEGQDQAVAAGEAAPPDELVVVPLIDGQGAQVSEGQRVFLTFTSTRWESGERIDATGAHQPVAVDLDDAMAGVRAGILDLRVGTRVLLVVPPDQGNGSDTMVLVVDVLAAYTPNPIN